MIAHYTDRERERMRRVRESEREKREWEGGKRVIRGELGKEREK